MNIEQDVELGNHTTFRIHAAARYFAAFSSLEALTELLGSAYHKNGNTMILGGGSNVLFTKNYNGLVLKNNISGITVVDENANDVFVKAGAGVNWHQFVLYCLQHDYAGIENLSLIPGNVGASPMQNIGAYGVEIKDVFFQLEAFHIQDKVLKTFSLEECQFGYRDSVFKRRCRGQYVITSVTFRLSKVPRFNTSYGAIQQELEKMGIKDLTIQAISQAVINIRTSKLPDPQVIGNAGSFFKNPQVPNTQFEGLKKAFPNIVAFPVDTGHTKLAAGWLIEQCGWKGFRRGDAGCYPKQALVLVNYGKAKGEDIFQLSEEIIESVKTKFGVALEREVNVV